MPFPRMKPREYPPYEDAAGLKFPGLAIGLAGIGLAALAVFFIRSGGRLAALVTSLLLAACASPVPAVPPLGQTSFDAYRFETSAWLQQHRQFQTDNRADELSWNSPGEWRPQGVAEKGVLLLHGLGDSPWSFADIAKQLAEQGFLVRTVLLPGHGTRPADMLGVSVDDWHRVVDEQMAILAKDVPQVMVGGFSTGANLALEYALDHDAVSGLLLFSPAFKSRAAGIDWVLPWLAPVKPWLRQPSDGQAQQTPVRYTNVPTNGFAQYYRSSASVRAKLAKKSFDKPALLVVAEHDSVVNVAYAFEVFASRFTHPASRLVWYGALPKGRPASPRVLVRSDAIPAERISQFSHMSVLFSPRNALYGRAGSLPLCWNGQNEADYAKCLAGGDVWYADWGYEEPPKIHARLTFNPYFEWQTQVMNEVALAASKR